MKNHIACSSRALFPTVFNNGDLNILPGWIQIDDDDDDDR
jgi:hypothetical protein